MKSEVLDVIGETGLRREAAVNAALAANDRVKYLFSLLQMAISRAAHPDQPAADLRRERLASGVTDASLDAVVAGAARQGRLVMIPSCREILDRVAQELRVMAAPLEGAAASAFAGRLETLLDAMPRGEGNLIDPRDLDAMTRTARGGEDSVHQLVMDLHKALNAMQTALARETLDGAAVYGLTEDDRGRVQAFMAGLNRTAKLKFDHPGLGTTATRAAGRLVIQNDIGTTDAHVIVIHVEGLMTQVTYTDVHAERLQFLQDILSRYPVTWEGSQTLQSAQLAGGMPFRMAIGQWEAPDEAALRAWLGFLASRLVFLIDWNRARKALRGFLRPVARNAVLRWAADEEVGHRGFLELGGAALINRAIEQGAGGAVHFGDRLCDVLGAEPAEAFVRFVLRTATEGLRTRQSQALIRDRIRAELQTHFRNEGRRLLGLVADHAGFIFEISVLVHDGAAAAVAGERGIDALAGRARRFEHDADEVVAEVREAVLRRRDHEIMLQLVEAADDAADELEEAAFLLAILTDTEARGRPLDRLAGLAGLLMDTAQEWIRVLANADVVVGPHVHEDADDFLIAIDRVTALEHQADDAERSLRSAAVQDAQDFRQLHLYSEIGRALEAGADAFKRASLMARDYVLGTALGG